MQIQLIDQAKDAWKKAASYIDPWVSRAVSDSSAVDLEPISLTPNVLPLPAGQLQPISNKKIFFWKQLDHIPATFRGIKKLFESTTYSFDSKKNKT